MRLIESRSESIEHLANLPSYEVVVLAVAMTNVSDYVNSLNALEIKTTELDEIHYYI
ncbi:MAG: hypothetical protein MRQ13_01875 [Candidatus Midichloria sp.]|nr:hypothetical protein [Candidatus Midichloria sp.]